MVFLITSAYNFLLISASFCFWAFLLAFPVIRHETAIDLSTLAFCILYMYIYEQGLSCQHSQAKSSMLNIFVKDINSNNQLSLHGVSWVLFNLQITIQYFLTCKNKIKTYSGWMQIVVNIRSKYQVSCYLNFGSKIY